MRHAGAAEVNKKLKDSESMQDKLRESNLDVESLKKEVLQVLLVPAATLSSRQDVEASCACALTPSCPHAASCSGKLLLVKNSSGGWGWPFIILFLMLVALAGVGYNRYRKIMKSHLP
eukprot:6149644-Pleurochrysis_carterae.AAC.2